MASKSTVIAVRGEKARTEIEVSSAVSLIALQKDDILARLREGTATDVVTADLTNVMLQAVVNILPSVELLALSNPRGVYPLEKLLGMARELVHDAKSSADRNQMRMVLMGEIIDPSLLRFAQEQITQLNALERRVRNDPQTTEFVAKMKANVASTVNSMRIKISDSLDAYFGGDGGATSIIKEADAEVEIYTPDDGAVSQELTKAATRKKASRNVR